MGNRKEIIKNSLRGETIQEKHKDLLSRDFLLNMKDFWNSDDYELSDIFLEIKKELEKEMEKENE